MLTGIGITDTNMKLILNIVYAVVGWVASIFGSRLHDVVGRRKMLITSTAGMTVCLAIVAGSAAGYTEYGNKASSTVTIVFIFLFGAIFACGFTPMQPIYPAEVVSNKMRAKAMGTFKLTAGAAGFLNTFVGPIALSNVSLRTLRDNSARELTSHSRLGTGSMCSLYFGTLLSWHLCTFCSLRPKARLLRSLMSSLKRRTHGMLVLQQRRRESKSFRKGGFLHEYLSYDVDVLQSAQHISYCSDCLCDHRIAFRDSSVSYTFTWIPVELVESTWCGGGVGFQDAFQL